MAPRRLSWLLVYLLISWTIGGVPAGAQEAVSVRADKARYEQLNQTVPVIGRLVALERGEIAAREAGAVDKVLVDVGDRVKAGDVLAILDADRVRAERDLRAAEVVAAEAQVAAMRAELGLERQELTRAEQLRGSPAFSEARFADQRQEVRMAEAKLAQQQAAVAMSQAQLRLSEIALSDMEVRAPFAGVVTRRHADVGTRLDEGEPVVSLIDDRRLEIEVDVPAVNIGGLTPGSEVSVRLDDVPVVATVRAILPVENALTRTRTVRLRSDFTDIPHLVADQTVVVNVPSGPPRIALSVHKDAVLFRNGGAYVFVVAAAAEDGETDGGAYNGKADLRRVRLGEAVGNRFEVIEGLKENDNVVIRGNERLRPGQMLSLDDGRTG